MLIQSFNIKLNLSLFQSLSIILHFSKLCLILFGSFSISLILPSFSNSFSNSLSTFFNNSSSLSFNKFLNLVKTFCISNLMFSFFSLIFSNIFFNSLMVSSKEIEISSRLLIFSFNLFLFSSFIS